MKIKPKITWRGWAGHFGAANSCQFRLNTLIEYDDIKIVVSTVGRLKSDNKNEFLEIGVNRYFETMAFHADDSKYHDADVGRQIYFDSQWAYPDSDMEIEASNGHAKVVEEICQKLVRGERFEVSNED